MFRLCSSASRDLCRADTGLSSAPLRFSSPARLGRTTTTTEVSGVRDAEGTSLCDDPSPTWKGSMCELFQFLRSFVSRANNAHGRHNTEVRRPSCGDKNIKRSRRRNGRGEQNTLFLIYGQMQRHQAPRCSTIAGTEKIPNGKGGKIPHSTHSIERASNSTPIQFQHKYQ